MSEETTAPAELPTKAIELCPGYYQGDIVIVQYDRRNTRLCQIQKIAHFSSAVLEAKVFLPVVDEWRACYLRPSSILRQASGARGAEARASLERLGMLPATRQAYAQTADTNRHPEDAEKLSSSESTWADSALEGSRRWVVLAVSPAARIGMREKRVIAFPDCNLMREYVLGQSSHIDDLLVEQEQAPGSLPELPGLWLGWVDIGDGKNGWRLDSEWRRLTPEELAAVAAGRRELPVPEVSILPEQRDRAETLAQELLACSFAWLLELNATEQHPALMVSSPAGDAFDPLVRKFIELADLYDQAQAARGDCRRAVRR